MVPVFAAGVGGASGTDVGAAEATLELATTARVEAEGRLATADAEKASLLAEIQRLDAGAAQITKDLAAAQRAVREYAVAAYIDGGNAALVGASLDMSESASLAWRAQVVGNQTVEAADAVDRLNALKASNDPDRMAAASRLDEVTSSAEEALSDALQAAAYERDAEVALGHARDAEAQQRAEVESLARSEASASQSPPKASGRGDPTPKQASKQAQPAAAQSAAAPAPAASGSGSPSAGESATLAKIRRCESRGNYGIVSASGKYRGAYQFDTRTWASIGGSGDPAAASPAEQDYRALLLLRQRGTRPWPNCG